MTPSPSPSTVSSESTPAAAAAADPDAQTSSLDEQVVPTAAEAAAMTFDGRAAYERRAALIALVDETEMLPLNRDPVGVVTIALRAWPAIASYRALLEKTYVSYDFASFDALPDFANATQYLNERMSLARVGTDELATVFTRAGELRDLILGDIPNLVRRRQLPENIRGEMRGPFGYEQVAYDLGRLTAYYVDSWEIIKGNTGMSRAEIAEAEALSGRLRFLFANRQKTDAVQAERALRRQQAFTLLARTYDTIRKSLIYVLHLEGKRDVDAVAPSIYAIKRGKKSASENETASAEPKAPTGEQVAPAAPPKPMQPSEGVPADIDPPFGT
jgi:hypothetical protein